MRTITLMAFLAETEARSRAAGVDAVPVDALRNRGGNRTAAKREMLRRAADRARAAGLEPIPSYF